MKWLKARLVTTKNWLVEKWKAFLAKAKEWIETYEKRVFLILVGSIFIVLILWLVPKWQTNSLRRSFSEADMRRLDPKDRIQFEKDVIAAENNARVTLAQILGGVGLLFGLYLTYRNIKVAHKNVEVAEQGKLTERFSKAVELLGSEKIEVRLGGIYALERIAWDSMKDHWTVMEVLTAFVREQSKEALKKMVEDYKSSEDKEPAWFYIEQPKTKLRDDIQAALTVIGRRRWVDQETEHQRIDLRNSALPGASLFNAKLQKAIFRNTVLVLADFERAELSEAHFTNANLNQATLSNTVLFNTRMKKAELANAILNGTDLSNAVGLVWDQISGAILDEETKLPPELDERRKAEQENKPVGTRAEQ